MVKSLSYSRPQYGLRYMMVIKDKHQNSIHNGCAMSEGNVCSTVSMYVSMVSKIIRNIINNTDQKSGSPKVILTLRCTRDDRISL
jgi:hypothetical protein